jgi:hypothetical protein
MSQRSTPSPTKPVAPKRRMFMLTTPQRLQHAKLDAVIEQDMFHLQALEALRGFDACFFVSAPVR